MWWRDKKIVNKRNYTIKSMVSGLLRTEEGKEIPKLKDMA